MLSRSLRHFSKYKKVTKALTETPETHREALPEPSLNFKPFTHSVYTTSSNFELIPSAIGFTKPFTVPDFLYKNNSKNEVSSPPNAKYAEYALFGPVNSGKSSLLNTLINRNVSAVSSKSHTTYDCISGIHTDIEKKTQIVLHDLPGYSSFRKDQKLANYWKNAFAEIEKKKPNKVLFVFDANKRPTLTYLKALENFYKKFSNEFPLIRVFNKMDFCYSRSKLNEIADEIDAKLNFERTFYTSCETGFGIESLRQFLVENAQNGQWKFNQNASADLNEVQAINQIIKTAVFERFYNNLPFQVQFEVTEFFVKDNLIRVCVQFNVAKDRLKAMLIGKKAVNFIHLRNRIQKQLAGRYGKMTEVILNVQSGPRSLVDVRVTDEQIEEHSKEVLEAVKKQKSIQPVLESK